MCISDMAQSATLLFAVFTFVALAAFLLLLYAWHAKPKYKRRKKDSKKLMSAGTLALLGFVLTLTSVFAPDLLFHDESLPFDYAELPEYDGQPWIVVNDDEPYFLDEEMKPESYVHYSSLDLFGRCGPADAVLSADTLPTEDRESIAEVKPTGWQSVRYDFVDGESLYNRCHLIAFSLCGANAEERNLITGTRSMNINGMLDNEMEVLEYIRETGNHVRYRVTPVFVGDELVARGVLMEAWSIEDAGEGICYCIYAYNVEPGVEIDYRDGSNHAVN